MRVPASLALSNLTVRIPGVISTADGPNVSALGALGKTGPRLLLRFARCGRLFAAVASCLGSLRKRTEVELTTDGRAAFVLSVFSDDVEDVIRTLKRRRGDP